MLMLKCKCGAFLAVHIGNAPQDVLETIRQNLEAHNAQKGIFDPVFIFSSHDRETLQCPDCSRVRKLPPPEELEEDDAAGWTTAPPRAAPDKDGEQ